MPIAPEIFQVWAYTGIMTIIKSPPLEAALRDIAMPGVWIGHRIIAQGDELGLLPEEQTAFAHSVVKVQRASGAARIVARELMQRMGIAPRPVLKGAGGMPQWPDGFVGSIAHDSTIALAALARRSDHMSIGIDVEPAEAIEPDLVEIVATERERSMFTDAPLQARLLFAIKEAVYKAAYPLDRTFLEHHDVEVNLPERTAAIRDGRTVPFRYGLSSHIAVLAFIEDSR
jgi:4'-phosphopantetheinyl transferase EntD